PHLFERFYRGKNAAAQSAGIGLALSRTILAAQNGTIKAENRPEGGARFIIRLYKTVV
ncbi:MAG: sensor histidine kinase, partial [bacterium]|nr:sensor histidine kinase [bacterium]